MNKKYTVFLSSTYEDLREERREAIHVLLEMGCIPCCMETFPADNEEQFEFIKSVIEECDYYILIIAGRYGSSRQQDGISFTEMEYNYAVRLGIPIATFIHKNIGMLCYDKIEKDEKNRKRLDSFVENASNGRLVKYWKDKTDLARKIAVTMDSMINRHPAIGWIRNNYDNENISCFKTEEVPMVNVIINYAIHFKERNEFEKSKVFFECALILDTNNESALRELGGLYFDSGNYNEALTYWQKLLNIQESCRNYYLCAIANYCLNEYNKSYMYCKKALLFPDDGFIDLAKKFVNENRNKFIEFQK